MKSRPLDAFVSRIRGEFPDFAFSKARFAGEGLDHTALCIDGEWIFRFRKPTADTGTLAQELRVLEALQGRSPVRVPDYAWVSRARDFGGYRIIPGRELTARRFGALDRRVQKKVCGELAGFLSALHGLPAAIIEEPLEPLEHRYAGYYRTRYRTNRRAVLAAAVPPTLIKKLDRFYDGFNPGRPKARKVIHVDIKDKHVLLSPNNDGLGGILDFTDATLWDPARDFAFVWGYGAEAARAVYGAYAYHDDAGLMRRALAQGVRVMIDRVYYDIADPRPKELKADLEALRALLALV